MVVVVMNEKVGTGSSLQPQCMVEMLVVIVVRPVGHGSTHVAMNRQTE